MFYLYHSNKLAGNAFADVSSAASDFQRLSIRESKLEVPLSGDNPTVVLPNNLHLQALAAKCSHLSFGTFNCSSNTASSVILGSNLSRNGLEEKSAAVDSSLAEFSDARHFLFRFQLDILSFVYCYSFSYCFLSVLALYTMVINSLNLRFLEEQQTIKMTTSFHLLSKSF